MAQTKDPAEKTFVTNRKARHDYHVLETYEAGIALAGSEVKSIRAGQVNFKDSYAHVRRGEVILENVHISPYEPASRFNHEPERPRKLLLHKREIRKLIGKVEEKGKTLVPLRMYLKKGRVKIELALAEGKKDYDKRQDIAKRDMEREMRREYKNR